MKKELVLGILIGVGAVAAIRAPHPRLPADDDFHARRQPRQ